MAFNVDLDEDVGVRQRQEIIMLGGFVVAVEGELPVDIIAEIDQEGGIVRTHDLEFPGPAQRREALAQAWDQPLEDRQALERLHNAQNGAPSHYLESPRI